MAIRKTPILPFVFQKRLFLMLSLVFMAFVVIGTLSHETGHYLMDRYYGYNNAHFNYAYTFPGYRADNDTLLSIWRRNQFAIQHQLTFAEKARYDLLMRQMGHRVFMISMAGPLQTMFTGTLGFLLILIFGRTYRDTDKLKPWQWLFVFLSLFWMRQVCNMMAAFVIFMIRGDYGYGDEIGLSYSLGWYPLAIYAVTAALGIGVFCVVLFRYIPPLQRFTFFLAGLVAGLGGAILWLYVVGPVVMP